MKNTSETVEFFSPKNSDLEEYLRQGEISAVHHLARYQWVSEITSIQRSGRILDIACGAGYGTYMIAKSNPDISVVGIDYDVRAIEISRRTYSAPNLSYEVGDIVKWCNSESSNLGVFEIIISFDTIEHLLHREIALVNIAENLTEDGSFFFSTPSGHDEPLLNPGWEHHKIEYSAPYLYNIVSRFFGEVLYPDDRSLPNIDYWDELNRKENVYWNRMNPIVCRLPIKFGLKI